MLKTEFCGIEFKNPILAASGTFSYGEVFEPYLNLEKIGGICTSGITYNKRLGNKGRRIHETPSGLMNSIGLQNESIQHFLDNDYPRMSTYNTNIIANLGGGSLEEYIKGIHLLNETDIPIIELNISCPNVKEGGIAFGIKSQVAEDVVKAVRSETEKILMVKLSPNCESIYDMAQACERAGADAISLVNTFNALAIDIYQRKPIFKNVTAGLSGPAIKPIALAMVHQARKAVDLPIVGIGGISNFQDVVEFLMAGADLVQVGTANFKNPAIMNEIIDDLEKFMIKENISDLSEIKNILEG